MLNSAAIVLLPAADSRLFQACSRISALQVTTPSAASGWAMRSHNGTGPHTIRKKSQTCGRSVAITKLKADAEEKDYCTSSGSAPVTWPLASVVIFSTRASACRNSSSQRRFKASPRS